MNPEVAHEHMAGLNMHHAVAQAIESNKLFHIDLNDQRPGRYDQDFRFGAENPKAAFYLVRLLEESAIGAHSTSTPTPIGPRTAREWRISPGAVCKPTRSSPPRRAE